MGSDAMEKAGSAFSAALNRVLALDADTGRRLARLDGRTVALGLRDEERRVYALIHNGRITLQWRHDGPVDVAMTGRLADYLALARANRRGESIAAGRIEITGDLAVAQEVQALLNELDLDWESAIAGYFGEVPAHRLGVAVRGAARGARAAARRFELDLAEFLHHEVQALPLRADVEDQRQAIFRLSDAVDRLEARFARRRQQARR